MYQIHDFVKKKLTNHVLSEKNRKSLNVQALFIKMLSCFIRATIELYLVVKGFI
jgi:hypothetical protein